MTTFDRIRLKGRGMFAGWDDEAFESFIEDGFVDVDGRITYKFPGALEAAVFRNTPTEIFRNHGLKTVRT